MDATLWQILAALFKAHQEIDLLRARIAELEVRLHANGQVPEKEEAFR